jgi:ferric-dicitrate binding protein FerR (iron transport regulator)
MKDLDWELFDRYLAGQASPADGEAFERWLAERPDRAEFVAAWRRSLAQMESGMAAADRAAVWAGPLQRVGRAASGRFPPAGWRERGWRVAGGVAAAALLVAGATLVGRAALLDRVPESPASGRSFSAPRGERSRFRLPDGTEVLLAAGSTLRHPSRFPGREREVALEGEAYFSVTHDPGRPFRVRAGDLIATDLGTEFLVRAYPEDGSARVVVRSGEVALRPLLGRASGAREPVVRPGEMGRLDRNGVPRIEPADTAAYFGWTEGTLVFDRTPLRDALPQLSRWFDLDFQLADSSLGSIPVSGRLDQTLTDTRLDLLAGSLGLKQLRRGRVVTLSRN